MQGVLELSWMSVMILDFDLLYNFAVIFVFVLGF
jgi:hypothetical protein